MTRLRAARNAILCFLVLGFLGGVCAAQEPTRPGRFQTDAQGVVTDWDTGLQWAVGPDRYLSKSEARAWAESLALAGGGWCMPTTAQLMTLRTPPDGPCMCDRVFRRFADTCGVIWAAEADPHASVGFNLLDDAGEGLSMRHEPGLRAFAVRPRP